MAMSLYRDEVCHNISDDLAVLQHSTTTACWKARNSAKPPQTETPLLLPRGPCSQDLMPSSWPAIDSSRSRVGVGVEISSNHVPRSQSARGFGLAMHAVRCRGTARMADRHRVTWARMQALTGHG
ncbi:hypothetical protein EDD36DRAFT_423724 [Exophiala viscosa]|uniref:Uncharacterized protein n=1 Tax=Exophiala viscosa TaxID=2486360 RepID=A0AAN6I8A0_9EURO|nr:hypothetical protein EDD36DRAFT_423724 [Exophiala viscosa]